MKVLALDLGASCGHCTLHPDGSVTYGLLKANSKATIVDRIVLFWHFLHTQTNLTEIIFEYSQFKKSALAHRAFWSYWALLLLYCRKMAIPHRQIEPGPLKKAATGYGNADKARMIATFNAKYKTSFKAKDDDIVDALWILRTFYPKEFDKGFREITNG